MANQITFKSQVLKTVEHGGKIWFTAATLATALEYSDAKSVSNIYNRNKDEFTPCMTVVVENINSGLANNAEVIKTMTSDKSKGYGNLITKTRVFSLRGAHLIAMFASTPVAKEFRRWLLDLIEEEAKHQQLPPVANPLPHGIHKVKRGNGYRYRVILGYFESLQEAINVSQEYHQSQTGRLKLCSGSTLDKKDIHYINLLREKFKKCIDAWRFQIEPALRSIESPLASNLHGLSRALRVFLRSDFTF